MWIQSIATSDIYKDDLITIQREWTMIDLIDAMCMLEAFADAREADRLEAERNRK